MPVKRRATPPGRRLLRHDRALGCRFVAGADEAGRGALAGPLVAAAVLLEPGALDRGARADLGRLDDSKRLSPAAREELALVIYSVAIAVGVVAVASEEIDRHGIQAANLGGLSRSLDLLVAPAGCALLVDGFVLPMQAREHRSIVRGDATSAAIAAASIIAKTTRDRVMDGLDLACPGYGFARHAGYGTAAHCEAIARLGPVAAHRRSFAPLSRAA